MVCQPTSYSVAQRKVCELIDEDNMNWDGGKLIEALGYLTYIKVCTTISPPVSETREDKLVFNASANGNFSVKCMFNTLIGQEVDAQQNPDPIWAVIWKKGSIPPRIRLFLWKIAHGALPLFDILAKRGIQLDKCCSLCSRGDETILHTFFHCEFARACRRHRS